MKNSLLKNDGLQKVLASLLSILVGLVVGAIVVAIVGLTKSNIGVRGMWDGIRLIFKCFKKTDLQIRQSGIVYKHSFRNIFTVFFNDHGTYVARTRKRRFLIEQIFHHKFIGADITRISLIKRFSKILKPF